MRDVLEQLVRISDRSRQAIPTEILFLLGLVGLIIFLWDLFDRHSKRIRRSGGLPEETEMVALRGSSYLPGRHYFSEISQLSSKPDALLKEDGTLIPVDFKPTSNKVKDRHVVQLLVHLRLIEEIEKQHPPYGILLMGREARRVKIQNTPEKQRWLDTLLDEMRSVMEGVPAVPAPAVYKCKGCDVREFCKYSAYKG